MKKIIFSILLLLLIFINKSEAYFYLSNQSHNNLQFDSTTIYSTINIGSDINNGTSPLTPFLTFEVAADALKNSGTETMLIIIASDTPYIISSERIFSLTKNILSNGAIITTNGTAVNVCIVLLNSLENINLKNIF